MPGLKQPTPLQTMASDVLVEWIVRFCDHLSVNVSLEKLHQGVAVIKENVCKRIPWLLLDRFCSKILKKFYSTERPASHHKVMLEIVMDIEILGLSLKGAGPILGCLEPQDVNRLRRLEILNLTIFSHFEHIELSNFYLNDLTKFVFNNECTDLHLEIIGRNCPRLEILEIRYSSVTDEGLLALSSCSELRVVDITKCRLLSHIGINQFLSQHKKLKKLDYNNHGSRPVIEEDNVLSCLDSSVQCPSLNHFSIYSQHVTDAGLRSILTKFPNLSYLAFNDSFICDLQLTTLNSLDKLTGIEFEFSFYEPRLISGLNMSPWKSFEDLSRFIGGRIKKLSMYSCIENHYWGQNELDFVFHFCPNIEYFVFEYGPQTLLDIPPFRELKQLLLTRVSDFLTLNQMIHFNVLEFGTMMKLEVLTLCDYKLNIRFIESIILDNVKFPNLHVIKIDEEFADYIEDVAIGNNLDIKIIDF